MHYAGCGFRGTTGRGAFGDALAETDWIVNNVMQTLRDYGLEENTLVLFTSDNGPWMSRLFTGRYAGYWNTAKGSTWEGGIREPAFAYWKGTITPFSRSAEIISSLDVFPTLSAPSGLRVPTDRVFDGRDMSQILLDDNGKSQHEFLFFHGTCGRPKSGISPWVISGVRHGRYKAHFCTSPGLGPPARNESLVKQFFPPFLFDVENDPSETELLAPENEVPNDPVHKAALDRIHKAYAMEKSTFEYVSIHQEPDGPGEGSGRYAICCDRSGDCYCKETASTGAAAGLFTVGTKRHHVAYHEAMCEKEPWSPQRGISQAYKQFNRYEAFME